MNQKAYKNSNRAGAGNNSIPIWAATTALHQFAANEIACGTDAFPQVTDRKRALTSLFVQRPGVLRESREHQGSAANHQRFLNAKRRY
jgi:hypothetical protein